MGITFREYILQNGSVRLVNSIKRFEAKEQRRITAFTLIGQIIESVNCLSKTQRDEYLRLRNEWSNK